MNDINTIASIITPPSVITSATNNTGSKLSSLEDNLSSEDTLETTIIPFNDLLAEQAIRVEGSHPIAAGIKIDTQVIIEGENINSELNTRISLESMLLGGNAPLNSNLHEKPIINAPQNLNLPTNFLDNFNEHSLNQKMTGSNNSEQSILQVNYSTNPIKSTVNKDTHLSEVVEAGVSNNDSTLQINNHMNGQLNNKDRRLNPNELNIHTHLQDTQSSITSVLKTQFSSSPTTTHIDSSESTIDSQLNSAAPKLNTSIMNKLSSVVALQPETLNPDISEADIETTIDTKSTPNHLVSHNTEKAQSFNSNRVVIQANIPVGMPGWADQLAERTATLASQNIKQAEIQLNPQELGPINVKISVTQEQAAVTFTATNPLVKDALDQTMQRLRDTFQNEGMELIQADVHDERQQKQQTDKHQQSSASKNSQSIEDDEPQMTDITVVTDPNGVDQFV